MTEVIRGAILGPHIILISLLAGPQAPLSLTPYNNLVKIGPGFLKLHLNIVLIIIMKAKLKGFTMIFGTESFNTILVIKYCGQRSLNLS